MHQFLAVSYLTITNELYQLWSYWTEFHEIFTRYRDIKYAVSAHIEITIANSVSECRSDKCRVRQFFHNFSTKLVSMATSLEESYELDRIYNTQTNIFHLMKHSENRSSRS